MLKLGRLKLYEPILVIAAGIVLMAGSTFVALEAVLLVLIAALYLRAFFQSKPDTKQNNWALPPDALPDAIVISDLAGKPLYANTLAKSLLPNFETAQSVTALFDEWHTGLNNRKPADEVVAAALSAPDFQFSETLHRLDGQVYERLTRANSEKSQRFWILRDISHLQQASHDSEMHTTMVEADAARTAELAEQLYHAKAELEANQAELTRLANTDSLTGLLNRRRFTALGEQCIQNATHAHIWVIMLDIDHFKRINDTYGHAAGDMAIRDFSAIIEKQVGSRGFVGRMGGEEFAAILADANVDDTIRIAETIRKKTAAHITVHGSEKFRFTTSVGVAQWLEGEITIEAALDRSDQALYSAKSYGRNRVVGYEVA